jgi:DNA polymerase III delta prime subunit
MKGIKLIREDLKFFAKTHIQSNEGHTFKSIVLLNADKLTMDAQSALRRLIELFSHNTRFFIIVEDKYKLLKPIISRFCEMYIPEPIYKGESINLYKYNINKTMKINPTKKARMEKLKKDITKTGICESTDFNALMEIAKLMYEDGYSGLDFIYLLENNDDEFFEAQKITNEKKYSFLVLFNTVKKEIKNEKLMILFILNFIFKDSLFDFTGTGVGLL